MTPSRPDQIRPAAADTAFDPQAALLSHDALRGKVQRDRAPLASAVFPLRLFGVITLLSAVVAAAFDDDIYGFYWALTGPLGGISISIYYARLEQRVSLRIGSYWPAVFVAIGVIVAASVLGGATSAPAAPFVAVAAGYLAFGLLWRSQATLVASSLIALIAAAAALVEPTEPLIWLGVSIGVVQLLAAAAEHREHRQSSSEANTGRR